MTTIYPKSIIDNINEYQKSFKAIEETVCVFVNYGPYDDMTNTINSFITNCTDIKTVDRWLTVCVGKSTNTYLDKLHQYYPFFIVIEEESLCREDIINKLRGLLPKTVKWVILICTGYIFFYNKNMEIKKYINELNTTSAPIIPLNRKNIDNYQPTLEEIKLIKKNNCFTDGYWPYIYSLPSILNIDILNKVGYTQRTTNSEYLFVKDYIDNGYNMAQLPICNYVVTDISQIDSIPKLNTIGWLNINVVCRNDKEWKNMKKIFRNSDVNLKHNVVEKYTNLFNELKYIFWGNDYSYRQDRICLYNRHLQIWNNTVDNFVVVIDGNTDVLTDIIEFVDSINLNGKYILQLYNRDATDNHTIEKVNYITDDILYGYVLSKSACKELMTKAFTDGIKTDIHKYINSCNMDFYKTDKIVLKPLDDSNKELDILQFDGYKFYSGFDSYYNDIGHYPDKSTEELKEMCDNNDECIAFNTLGWLKSNISDVVDFQPFNGPNGARDGIYVKDINKLKVQLYENKNKEIEHGLTFTITTCKRFNKFKETMDNLLLRCKDINIVDRWICIDDNSSTEDRDRMLNEYPFFDYIFKTEEQKGHAKSMNILWQTVETDYVLHFEDDWKCFEGFRIQKLLDIVKSNQLNQIVLRKNCWADHIPLQKVGNKMVYRYIYNHNHTIKPEINRKYDEEVSLNVSTKYGHNDMYWWWPGFTLNPSIFNLTKIKQLVNHFKEDVMQELFEYDYSLRLYEKGATIGYIDLKINHTGEISSYSLNDMKRYYDT